MNIVILLPRILRIAQLPGPTTAVDTISQTVTKALDAGTLGIAVLLAVGLIIMGGGVGLLVWKVIVPLLKQVILLTSQVMAIIERTNTAIEHSNETGTLQTNATNVQTGSIQKVDKSIGDMNENVKLLALNFGSYQTLTADTISGFRVDMDAFKAEVIAHVQNLIDISTLAAGKDDNAIVSLVEIHAKLDRIILLYSPPTPLETAIIPLNGEHGNGTDGLEKTG